MSSNRGFRAITLGLLIAALGAFAYFGLVRHQPRNQVTAGRAAGFKDDYYCPMHKNYHSDKPGNCPICGMKLVKLDLPAKPESPATAQAAGPTTGGQGDIFIAPEKQQLIGMHTVLVQAGTLTKELRLVGKVTYDETKLTHIHTKVSGYVEEVFADSVGKPVRAGEPLFTIYSPDLVSTEQDYLLALKSRNLLRSSTLASATQGSENLISAAKERLRLWDVTEGEIESLETEGKVKRAIAVYSPVSGVVMERAAYHHGTFVDPTKDLFTIVDLSRVWVIGEAYETDIPLIHNGQPVTVELPYSGGGRRLQGRVDFIYPFLDPKTRSVQVRMQFANPDLTLKPEMFANVTLTSSLGRQLLIPQDALMDTGTEQYVFLDKGNGYVQPQRVKVSAQTDDKVGIAEGLHAGDRVVTGANFIVDSESRLKGAFATMGAPSPAAAASPRTTQQALAVEVLEPKTAKTGMNPIRLMVKDSAGTPVAGAEVTVVLFMPQMGSMAPMSSKATLTEVGSGIYSGQIEFPMAWTWQTTVTVRKGGNVVGVAQTSVTAR